MRPAIPSSRAHIVCVGKMGALQKPVARKLGESREGDAAALVVSLDKSWTQHASNTNAAMAAKPSRQRLSCARCDRTALSLPVLVVDAMCLFSILCNEIMDLRTIDPNKR